MPTRPIRLLLSCLLFTLALLSAHPASAQATPLVDQPSAAEVDQLITTLEDPAKRDALLVQLKALKAVEKPAEPETMGSRVLDTLSDRIDLFSQQVAAASRAVIDTPRALRWLNQQMTDPAKRDAWGLLALHLALIIGGGYAARFAMIWLLSRPRRALGARAPGGLLAKLVLLFARLVLDLLPMGAFALVGFGLLSGTEAPRTVRVASLIILNASLIVQGVLVAGHVLLSPKTPLLRLARVGDETAQYLLIWIRRITIIGVYGYFIGEAMRVLGLPATPHSAWLKLVGLLVTAMLIVLVLQNREPVAQALRGKPEPEPDDRDEALRAVLAGEASGDEPHLPPPPTPAQARRHAALSLVRQRLADVWHILAILYLGAVYLIWALEIAGGFDFVLRATLVTGAILIVSRLLSEALNQLVDRGLKVPDDVRLAYPGLEERANRYLPFLRRVAQGLLGVFTILLLLQAWGADALSWLGSDLGQRVASSSVTILIVLTLALVIWEMVNGAILRYLNATDDQGIRLQRSARMRTLLPLMRNALTILLVTLAGLIVLSEFGVNIAPLLAGAGVIGLAVGFGAQTLVKDVITGLFILIEDTISVGDGVTVAGLSGGVEAMSIRSIRLRGYDGAVHTIPFSSVTTVTNSTKDFSFYVLNVTIDYAVDTDRVVGVLKDIGVQMQAEPDYGASILGPVEIAGVDAFQDSAVLIKGRIKTRAGQQWAVGREFNRRMKKRFDAEGITIPFPQQVLHINSGAPATPFTSAPDGTVKTDAS
ncbi:mechanosensitive ion channel domain-containing protein [Niveispirillum sp. KHB5.9]|uniref:mechanosensitive ion channel domain-containing protein n=1 Tax=Niveispirillum sp. KHB5.9 TaxID=3400269 RepID=UPI003A8AD933